MAWTGARMLDTWLARALLVGTASISVLAVLVDWLSGFAPIFASPGAYASIHQMLEIVVISISLMVVSVTWSSLSRRGFSSANSLIVSFTIVAIVSAWHAVVYVGMPSLVIEANANVAIYFWFCGRFAESLGLAMVALSFRLPGNRLHWLSIGLLAACVLVLVGLGAPDRLPVFIRPGLGVTPLKAGIEYALFAANMVFSLAIFRLSRAQTSDHSARSLVFLAWSCFLAGLSSIAFARYTHTNDWVNLLGHLLMISAYGCVYLATLHAGFIEPFREQERTAALMEAKERETRRFMETLPIGVASLGSDLRYRYVNPLHAASLRRSPSEIIGRSIDEIIPPPNLEQARRSLFEAFLGRRSDYAISYPREGGEPGYLQATVVPDPAAGEGQVGALALFLDVSDTVHAREAAAESMREVEELRAALDAHAIVAVTDAKGVIIRVNDKFCAISQYSRDELVGRTHTVVNSGTHDRGFFQDLWKTITRGLVWNGEICNRAKDGSLYWVQTTIVPMIGPGGLPEQYIAIRADITKRVLAEQDAMRLALHDPLTGLPNRRLMMERLQQAMEACGSRGHCSALLLVDLDRFKEINDTLGHAAGDQLLKQCGNRLLRIADPSDTVARLGGDEFALILGELGNDVQKAMLEAQRVADRIRNSLAQLYMLAGQDIEVTASIGVAVAGRESARSDEVMKQADLALYRAKDLGRNAVAFFDPVMQAELVESSMLLRDLRQAIERGELQLYFQPVVHVSRRIVGVEALLRWHHPERGLVSPAAFIPLAETHGLILDIGNWVLDQACTYLARWQADPVRADWTIAVNVSARQFFEQDFVARVTTALEKHGARADRLFLELTESMLHDDLDRTIEKMSSLRHRGVRFSLDDFGTGYSSLSYLKRLPIDQLKIDQSFVSDILTDANDAAIAKTVLALASTLELSVVAEGVETEGQRAFLAEHGCSKFQGYLFSRPVPEEALSALAPA